MITAERPREIQIPESRKEKALVWQLFTHFKRFVGDESRNERLSTTPDFLDSQGNLNQEWIIFNQNERRRKRDTILAANNVQPGENILPFLNPGAIKYDEEKKEWQAVDPDSPIGKIETLRTLAKEARVENITEDTKKWLEAETRSALTDIFNDYAGERFNGVRDVVKGNDFRGINLSYMASRSLYDWRGDLVRTRRQSEEPVLFERWEESENKKIQTPTKADKFFSELFLDIATSGKQELTPATEILKEIVSPENPQSYKLYLETADFFYAGDMKKTYLNLSAVAKMTGARLPEKWQGFQGNTTEFRTIRSGFEKGQFQNGLDGYLAAADSLYAGDMKKTYLNLSAVAKMTGARLPEKWQEFQGNTTEFVEQKPWVFENPNAEVETFMQVFNIKSRDKARLNLAAIRNMTRIQQAA